MGLWDICKEVGGLFLEGMNKRQEELNHYKELYRQRDDYHLKRAYKSADGIKKVAIACVLRERGITPENE